MNISGILVHADPKNVDDVEARLTALPGVEVHMRSDDGRLVVTAEEPGTEASGEIFLTINNLEGVISATLTYHHLEEEDHENDKA